MSRQRLIFLVMTCQTLFLRCRITKSSVALSKWRLTGKVKRVCSDVFSLISHSQNVWQAWHDWDCPFRQGKAEEDRDEREKPSAHQREWVSLVSVCVCVLLNATEALILLLQQFSCQTPLITSSTAIRLHAQQVEQRKKEKQMAATSAHYW